MATTSTLPPPLARTDQNEVRIYQHSMLFYWWPVWVIGYCMALWTWWDGHRMAILPAATTIHKVSDNTYTLAVPHPDQARSVSEAVDSTTHSFRLHVSQNPRLGAIFVAVLLLVILITNVPLRGLWSVIVIVTLILLSIILALANWW